MYVLTSNPQREDIVQLALLLPDTSDIYRQAVSLAGGDRKKSWFKWRCGLEKERPKGYIGVHYRNACLYTIIHSFLSDPSLSPSLPPSLAPATRSLILKSMC